MMAGQWNRDGGTLEQRWWNNDGGTVEQLWCNSATEMVEQCNNGGGTVAK